MAQPIFSIIIPTFNSVATLPKCLESLLKQTFQNFEVIIVDGLSTDHTLGIISSLEDKRISVISEHDKGIYDAMNKGIKRATGNWLYFLGSDDELYDEHVLLYMVEIISRNNESDVIYGNVTSTRFSGIYDGEFTHKKLLEKNVCHQSIFFKKNVFEKIGTFNIKYRSHADWEHNFRWLLSKNINKKFVNQTIAQYGDGGFSSKNPDHLFYRDRHLKYLKYGHHLLSSKEKLLLLKVEFRKSVNYRDYKKCFEVLLHTPYIFF